MNSSKIGSGDKVLDWGVIVAALILFAKTAELLSYYAPANLTDIVGTDVSLIYGIVSAALVEGLALALYFNHRAALSSPAQVVKWMLIGISAVCQVYDGFITTGSVAQMSDTMKTLLSYGVPLIPLLIMVMLFGIGRLPELDVEIARPKRPFIGLKPIWNRLINGNVEPVLPPPFPEPINLDVPSPELKPDKPRRNKAANPTVGNES